METTETYQPFFKELEVLTIYLSSPVTHKKINETMNRLLKECKYDEAAQYGDIHLGEIENNSVIYLTNQILYAKALMYTGRIKDAKNKLTSIKSLFRSYPNYRPEAEGILHGLVINHLGYIEWIYYGNLENAKGLFTEAKDYFGFSPEEHATTLDNLARVCAKLGEGNNARTYADDAFYLRNKTQGINRILLSQISRANIELDLGDLKRAYEYAKNAVKNLSGNYPRGAGLAYLILARVQAERTHTDQIDPKEAKKVLHDARRYLFCARDIFVKRVHEPIRLIEIYLALAHTYSCLVKTHLQQNINPKKYQNLANKHLDAAKDLQEMLNLVM